MLSFQTNDVRFSELNIPSSPKNSPCLEEDIDLFESEWELIASDLPPDQAFLLRQELRHYKAQLLKEHQYIRTLNLTSTQIRTKIKDLIKNVDHSMGLFLNQMKTAEQERKVVAKGQQVLASTIQSTKLSLKPFTPSKTHTSIADCYRSYCLDKAYGGAASTKITASTLNAIGFVAKEAAVIALGCRGSNEENCRIVAQSVIAGAKKVEEGIKYVITAMGAKPAIKRMMSGSAMTERLVQLGMEPECSGQWFHISAQQFVQDCNMITFDVLSTVVTAGTLKTFRLLTPSEKALKNSTMTISKDGLNPSLKGLKAVIGESVYFKNSAPYVLLPEAEEIAAKRGYYIAAEKRIIAEKKAKIAQRQKAIEEREAVEKLREEKRKSGLQGLESGFAQKQRAMQAAKQDHLLLQSFQPISLPHNFPKNITEFNKKSKNLTERVSYQVIENDILFFFRTHHRSLITPEKSLEKACHFANSKNYNRIFITWDPITHSIASVANKSTSIVGVDKLSREEFYPFELIEIKNFKVE